MLRKLLIRFKETGDYFREIDEERNYFLSEAEEVVEKIRSKLVKEKRTASPKPFEFWIDGQQAVISQVNFEKKESLEKQLEQTILAFESWEEETRYKITNLLKEYAEEERQLFLNKEFRAFAIRYDQLYGHSTYDPFPVHLDIIHLNQVYTTVQKHVSTGFYSELEKIMASIAIAIEKVNEDATKNIDFNQGDDFQKQKLKLEAKVYELLNNPDEFSRFTQYVAACFQSVPKSRIEALCPNFKMYQVLEQLLFKKYAKMKGFSEAYSVQTSLNQALKEKFDSILSKGFALSNDSMVESLVLGPVIQSSMEVIENFCEVEESEKSITNLSEC